MIQFYLSVALSCLFAVYVNAETTNCVKQADILFIVDASGSIGDENFEKVRNFLADFSRQYQVGKNLTHFSEIIFSSPPNINIVFGFNKYLTNTELTEALLRTPYPSGETYTAQALNLARTSAFTSANGARDGVPKIAVVLTDGKSTYPNDTSREAEDFKKSGAVVLAIGVSQKISPEELNTIATLPSYVFHVDDFAGLQNIINNVSKTVCTVVEQKAESTCVSLYRCLGRRDGDYPACAPECQEGYYYSCVNGYAYQRPCALGKYVDSNNEPYTALMVYDPATNKCQLTSSYCPRKNPKPYVAPNPPTAAPKSRPTECIQFNCKNKEDNDYPACFPECQQGYFYSCVNEFAYKRECALGWFIDTNNKPYTARLIYDPAKGSCEYDVPSCPRDKKDVNIIQSNSTQQTTTESCVRDKSCEGYKDGFYPPCDAGCCNAKYYECSNHKTMELECTFGWFLDANNQRYTEKLIYDPIKNTCEYSAPSCSRGQIPAPELPATTTTTPQPTTTTEGPCVVEDNCEQFNDGVFPPCGAGCNNIHYYECRNYKAYYRTCNVGQVYSSSQKKCVLQTGAC